VVAYIVVGVTQNLLALYLTDTSALSLLLWAMRYLSVHLLYDIIDIRQLNIFIAIVHKGSNVGCSGRPHQVWSHQVQNA
jgi:hypothetical protein